jgi:hypothetical protein
MPSTPIRSAAACAIAAAALALAAACTSSSTQAQPGPGSTTGAASTQSTASGKPTDGGSYSNSSDVISALKSVGHPCTPVTDSGGTNLTAPGLRSVAACKISTSGSAVTATVFDNHADAQTYASVLTSSQASGLLVGGTAQRAVVGQNWVVLVPDDTAYAAQVGAALGGSVVGGVSSSAG